MDKAKIYKVFCEYYVQGKDLEEIKRYVSQECGDFDFYEKHMIIEEVSECPNTVLDVDLTKGK